MDKTWKNRLAVLCMVLMIFCMGITGTTTPVWGYDEEIYNKALAEKNYSPTNVLAWRQFSEIPGTLAWQQSQPVADGYNVASGGCTWFAHCFFFVRCGLWDPEKDGTLKEFYEKYYPKAPGYFPCGAAISAINSKITCVTQEGNGQTGSPNLSMTHVKKRVKEIYEMGDFAVGYFSGGGVGTWGGHAVFLEGFDDDGNFIVTDGSFPGPDMYKTVFFQPFLSKGDDNPICYMLAQYHVEGVDSRDTLNLWERYGDGTDGKFINTGKHSNSPDKAANDAKRAWLMSEYEAIGFDNEALMVSLQKMVDPTGEISKREQKNLGQLKADINNSRFDIVSFLNTVVSIIGLTICIYSVLLLLAFAFDKSNTLTEGQLLSKLTLDRIYALPKGMEKPPGLDRKKYKTTVQIMLFIFGLFLLGLGIMSGAVYKLLYILMQELIALL